MVLSLNTKTVRNFNTRDGRAIEARRAAIVLFDIKNQETFIINVDYTWKFSFQGQGVRKDIEIPRSCFGTISNDEYKKLE